MISFTAFSDELQKIAQYDQQYDPDKGAKIVGALTGMGLGAAGGAKLVGKSLGGKARIPAAVLGALVGGLGGREVGEGAATAGRGLRMTAAGTRQALR